MVTIANPPPELRATPRAEECAVEKALAVVGAKWTLIVLHHLMDGPRRLGDLQRLVAAAPPQTLPVRLRDRRRRPGCGRLGCALARSYRALGVRSESRSVMERAPAAAPRRGSPKVSSIVARSE